MAESWDAQRERLELMARGDSKWDLSPNDCAAIRASLDRLAESQREAKAAREAALEAAAALLDGLVDLAEEEDDAPAGRWAQVVAERIRALRTASPPPAAQGVDLWGVFDTWERRWCPEFGTEAEMGQYALGLTGSFMGSAKPFTLREYRYQPLPLPKLVDSPEGAEDKT